MSPRRKNSVLTHRTLSGMGWASTGAAAEMVLHVVVVAVLARLISPADFGVVSIALVVTGFVGIFGELGLSPAVIQRAELTQAHVRAAFAGSMLLAFGTMLIVVLLAPLIAAFFKMPELTAIIRVVSVSLLFKALGVVPSALLQREMRFRDVAAANVLSYFLGFGVVGVLCAVFGWGAWALVAAQLAQTFTQTVRLHFAHAVRPAIAFEKQAMNELLSFGTHASIARVLNYAAVKGDNIVVGHLLGPSALGLYGRAYQIMAMPADLFQKVVQAVLLPALASVQNEATRLSSAYQRGTAVTALAVLPASACVVVLVPEIVKVLLGDDWTAVIPPLRILAAGMFFRVAYKQSAVLAQATAIKRFAARQPLYPVVILGGSTIGAQWGIEGVAVGVVVALACHYISLTQLALDITGLKVGRFASAHVPAVVLSAVTLPMTFAATAAMRAIDSPALLTLLVVGTAAFGVAAVLIVRWPEKFIGPEGQWLVQALRNFIRRKRHAEPRSSIVDDSAEPTHVG